MSNFLTDISLSICIFSSQVLNQPMGPEGPGAAGAWLRCQRARRRAGGWDKTCTHLLGMKATIIYCYAIVKAPHLAGP